MEGCYYLTFVGSSCLPKKPETLWSREKSLLGKSGCGASDRKSGFNVIGQVSGLKEQISGFNANDQVSRILKTPNIKNVIVLCWQCLESTLKPKHLNVTLHAPSDRCFPYCSWLVLSGFIWSCLILLYG